MTDESANQAIHPAALPIHELRDVCELRFQRRSGPGGQHRNKVDKIPVNRIVGELSGEKSRKYGLKLELETEEFRRMKR